MSILSAFHDTGTFRYVLPSDLDEEAPDISTPSADDGALHNVRLPNNTPWRAEKVHAAGVVSKARAKGATAISATRHSAPASTSSDKPPRDFEADGEGKKWKNKTERKLFEATLSSFQELINAKRTPTSIAETVERLKPMIAGRNFQWESDAHGATGSELNFGFQLILWHQTGNHSDMKTHTSTSVSFNHYHGTAYVYKPVIR